MWNMHEAFWSHTSSIRRRRIGNFLDNGMIDELIAEVTVVGEFRFLCFLTIGPPPKKNHSRVTDHKFGYRLIKLFPRMARILIKLADRLLVTILDKILYFINK